MSWNQDNFASAAVRHLEDAQLLLAGGRVDGAVHSAGFAAECAMKALVRRALPSFDGKDGGHELDRLANTIDAWIAAVTGDRDLYRLACAVSQSSSLAAGHPQRRYWGTGWKLTDAMEVVELAGDLVDNRVVGPWIDHGHMMELL